MAAQAKQQVQEWGVARSNCQATSSLSSSLAPTWTTQSLWWWTRECSSHLQVLKLWRTLSASSTKIRALMISWLSSKILLKTTTTRLLSSALLARLRKFKFTWKTIDSTIGRHLVLQRLTPTRLTYRTNSSLWLRSSKAMCLKKGSQIMTQAQSSNKTASSSSRVSHMLVRWPFQTVVGTLTTRPPASQQEPHRDTVVWIAAAKPTTKTRQCHRAITGDQARRAWRIGRRRVVARLASSLDGHSSTRRAEPPTMPWRMLARTGQPSSITTRFWIISLTRRLDKSHLRSRSLSIRISTSLRSVAIMRGLGLR